MVETLVRLRVRGFSPKHATLTMPASQTFDLNPYLYSIIAEQKAKVQDKKQAAPAIAGTAVKRVVRRRGRIRPVCGGKVGW